MRKRSVALLLGLVLAAGTAFAAQQQGKMGKRAKPSTDRQLNRMKADLNLTNDQTARVKELLEKQAQERQAWRTNNPKPTRKQMQTHREQMMRQMDEGLKKILTPEQSKKHEEMRRRGRRGAPKGPPQS